MQREDYDVAQSLKGEIDRLRTGIEQRLTRIPAFHEYVRKSAEASGAAPPQQQQQHPYRPPQQSMDRPGNDGRAPMQPIMNNNQRQNNAAAFGSHAHTPPAATSGAKAAARDEALP